MVLLMSFEVCLGPKSFRSLMSLVLFDVLEFSDAFDAIKGIWSSLDRLKS